ncbi:MAG: DUF4115 domain-containing protein [Caldilineaceae bacterium]
MLKKVLQVGLLLGLWVYCWSLGQPSVAQSIRHTISVSARTPSVVHITVDNKTVYQGVLMPGGWREWQGQRFTVEVGYTGDVDWALDQRPAGRLGRMSQVTMVRWPADILPANPISVLAASTAVTTSHSLSATVNMTKTTTNTVQAPTYYVVQPGDTLFLIAQQFNMDMDVLLKVNKIRDANIIQAGAVLAIPGSDGALPDPALLPAPSITGTTAISVPNRGTILERLTTAAQKAEKDSPFYKTTWLTYYGRPDTPIMGILGEYDIDKLTPLLKEEAKAYDQANGAELDVMPAFHLVYGMATKAPGDDNSHLAFLTDEVVKAYVERAEKEQFAVILDIQIGALKPDEAIKPGLPWLKYKNVHLAIDPEFAMVHKNQTWPGNPIGYITAQQVNEVQDAIQKYMAENKIEGTRILLVHQFQDDMIIDKAKLDLDHNQIALTIVADGWGDPWGKISKYNLFVQKDTKFGAFKLFYKWDEPLLTERQALGVDPYGPNVYIDVTPNLVIYQ